MPLPKAVEEAGRRATELQQRATGTTPPAPAEAATPAGTEPASAPAPQPTLEPENIPRPALPEAPGKDWEQMYRVLQGKYNHEVPRLTDENKKLKGELQTLKTQVEELSQRMTAQPPTPAPAAVRPEELEQYGPEFIGLVERVARSVVPTAPAAAPKVDPNLEDRLARAEETSQAALRRQFFNDLTAAVPQWETLNTDTGFLKWLDQVDEGSGATRQSLFDDAAARFDVKRVAFFFKSYGGNVGVASNGAPPANEQVTPVTMRGQPDVPSTKRIWNRGEIQTFFRNVREGRISPEDAARVEQDIFAAQSEGRVR